MRLRIKGSERRALPQLRARDLEFSDQELHFRKILAVQGTLFKRGKLFGVRLLRTPFERATVLVCRDMFPESSRPV
jgi:hypothetical protein